MPAAHVVPARASSARTGCNAPPRHRRRAALLAAVAICQATFLLGCRTTAPAGPDAPAAVAEQELPPAVTRGEFTIHADKLDTWNAVGQIIVRTPGVEYLGRAQMLDLYSVRAGGVEFLVLTKALLASETQNRLTTRVTATTPAGKPIDHDAVAGLLVRLQGELPQEIERVQARQQAERKAGAKKPRR